MKKLRAAKTSAEAKAASAISAAALVASNNERGGFPEGAEAEEGDLEGPDQRKRRSLQAAAKAAAVPSAPPAVSLPLPSPGRQGPTHILFLPPHITTRPRFFKWVQETCCTPGGCERQVVGMGWGRFLQLARQL